VVAAWTGWNDVARAARIMRVTALPEWSVDAPQPDAGSPTGYEHGWRRLILPEHNYASYLWITQAQAQLAGGPWRVRHIDYENAPVGRASQRSSPYAWWLAGLAWADHTITGSPAGICVERAALYGDPLLHLLLVVAAFVSAWRLLGPGAAAVTALGLLGWFPLNANFVPGAPDRAGLLLGVNLLAAVLWASVLQGGGGGKPPAGRWRVVVAGVLHGFGLWLDVVPQAAVIVGYGLGGLALGWLERRRHDTQPPAVDPAWWRWWALGGAGIALAGYLAEYAPGALGFHLTANHPLYALAWLGLAEGVAMAGTPGARRGGRAWARWAAASAVVGVLPVLMLSGADPLPWQLDPEAARLSVVHPVNAENLWAWLWRDGLGMPVLATLLPAVGAGGLLLYRRKEPAVIVLGGPVLLIGALALWQLSWWSSVQACLLAAAAAVLTRAAPFNRGVVVAVAAAGLPGLLALMPAPSGRTGLVLNESELAGLIERDLAHRLAQRGRVGVVLAPPATTAALHFYGGLAGLGTFAWENQAGLTAAARIASASSPDEAAELMRVRNITHIVMPGWDDFLDEYAGLGRSGRIGAPVAGNSFVAALHRWEPPPWLRPRAYPVPPIAGLEGRAVELFEVTDPQDAPTALSRMAEFFLETGRMDYAAMTRRSLAGYPAHLGALAAAAKVEAARGDGAAFAETVGRILPLLEARADRNLAWDRRVTLALVLYSAKHADLARAQLQRCLREATAERLQALGDQSTLQLLLLGRRLELPFPSPELERLAVSLLPPDARPRGP
jgi:hypothetical protein